MYTYLLNLFLGVCTKNKNHISYPGHLTIYFSTEGAAASGTNVDGQPVPRHEVNARYAREPEKLQKSKRRDKSTVLSALK